MLCVLTFYRTFVECMFIGIPIMRSSKQLGCQGMFLRHLRSVKTRICAVNWQFSSPCPPTRQADWEKPGSRVRTLEIKDSILGRPSERFVGRKARRNSQDEGRNSK